MQFGLSALFRYHVQIRTASQGRELFMKPRTEARVSAQETTFDVCVIGGGATGAGCALDAQLRGLQTLLIEAKDFASGASSASTKLVHGGVRYLEQAVKTLNLEEFRVVKNALQERRFMMSNAPYLAHAAHFLIPVYSWIRAGYYLTGMKVYDAVAGKANLFPSGFLSREATLKRLPGLTPDHLRGAIFYSDGQFDDARYNLALVETFADSGGIPLNHARVTQFRHDADHKLTGANLRDELTGEEFSVAAKKFVNATGTGADQVRALANPNLPSRMRPSKGVHLLFPADLFPTNDALLVPQTEDGRVIFAVPWQSRLLVGTTDDEMTGTTRMLVEKDEAEYLLRQLNPYLENPLRLEQAQSGMAGLRPLVAHGEAKTSKLIRDHEVEVDARSGLISILGGKWTTYRLMAEDTINHVQRELGAPLTASGTKNCPLAGTAGFDERFSKSLEKEYSLAADIASHLTGKFGSRALQILRLLDENPAWRGRISPELPVIHAEVVFCIRNEMAETMEDLLARRTGAELYDWKQSLRAAPLVAALLGAERNWDAGKTTAAIENYSARIAGYLKELGLDKG